MGEEAFAEAFAQLFLEKNGYVRGESGKREIQPLFGWLLMESHKIKPDAKIEVAPKVKVDPTPGPLLIELGKAQFRLDAAKLGPDVVLGAVIDAHLDVQRLSQETMMRMVVGAQIMASLVAYKTKGDDPDQLTFTFTKSPSTLAAPVNKLLRTIGVEDVPATLEAKAFSREERRILFIFDSVGDAVREGADPFVLLDDWKKGTPDTRLYSGRNAPGDSAKKIALPVGGEDLVTVEVEWQ